jgi:acyl-CoA synthetase (AMP-forming)/AMP-acid ligase II
VSAATPDVPDNRVVVDGRSTTWSALASIGVGALPRVEPGTEDGVPLAVLDHGHDLALRAAARHQRDGGELLVAAAGRVDAAMRADLFADGFHLVTESGIERPAAQRVADQSGIPEKDRVWILTSGSTGRPKRVPHTLASLTTVGGDQPPRVWLCPYSPGTYAWWQVVTLSLAVPGQDLVTVDPAGLDDWPAIAARHGVTAVSGTPTFWRQTLMGAGDVLRDLPLVQVTLGGEPVDQAVLDRLADTLPTARISWIYASSEVGAAIAVHDGRAGFPVEWLDRPTANRPLLSIVDDELVIASRFAGDGFDGRVRTGDRVEVIGGRVLITGRRDQDEINVGGAKVSAGLVRDVLLAHPDVRWARVYGRSAPLVGRIVAAEVVADGALDEAGLRRWAAGRMSEQALPRRIRLLDAIPMKETLKSDV